MHHACRPKEAWMSRPVDETLARLTALDAYIEERFAAEDEALRAARAAMAEHGLPAINVSPTAGKLLFLLARLVGARRILEIGTLGGYSAVWLARALPPDGRLVTLELSELHAAVARANLARAGLADRVEIRLGPALDSLAALAAEGAGPFDLVFIDADKPPYPDYLEWALRLSRPGALIVADNVVQRGRVLSPESEGESARAMRRFNDLLSAHPRLDALILPLVRHEIDGLALALVRPSA
jgi:predicted O-methyltransferase YrrM